MQSRSEGLIGEPPKVIVRPARKNDAGPLGVFFMQSWREAGPGALGFTGANENAIKEIASIEFLSKRLASPITRIVVAERRGTILGFASIRKTGPGQVELSGIVVLQGEAGRGIGTRLLRKACDAAIRLGCYKVAVKTETFNARAIGFYKKNGFLEVRKTTEKIGRAVVPLMALERRFR